MIRKISKALKKCLVSVTERIFKNQVFALFVIQVQCRDWCRLKLGFLGSFIVFPPHIQFLEHKLQSVPRKGFGSAVCVQRDRQCCLEQFSRDGRYNRTEKVKKWGLPAPSCHLRDYMHTLFIPFQQLEEPIYSWVKIHILIPF